MKRAKFHPLADDEFAAAVAEYAAKADGLGERFYESIRQLVAEIEAQPGLRREWRHGARRHFNQRFPYAVVYVERATYVAVIAVAHCKRRPDYRRERLG